MNSKGLEGLSPAEKRALLQKLLAEKGARPPSAAPQLRASAEGERPVLSFAQERMWFLEQLEPGGITYNVPGAMRLTGPLDAGALERALAELARRHASLRATFSSENGLPVAVIAPPAPVPLPGVDLSALPPAEREAEVQRRVDDDARQPFDLAKGPLMRAGLLRLGPEEHVLLLSLHHIVTDGWSMGLLFRELGALYGAFRAGQPSPLPEPALQYADFARWQQEWLTGEVLEKQLAYWRQQLAGAPAALELPTDRPRPAVQTSNGALLPELELSPALADGLRRLAQKEGCTLFMLLQAAFATLLHRYSGQEDLAIGTPIAGRSRTELEGLIGLFINTLVLRVRLSGDPTFRELLSRVRETALGAFSHQDVPFEKLVEELEPARDLSRPPFFQVTFDVQKAPPPLSLAGLGARPVTSTLRTAKFDLALTFLDRPAGLAAQFEYNTDLFDAGTVQRMAGHLRTLLEAAVAAPDTRVSALPLLSPDERRKVVAEWNATRTDYPQGDCVQHLFEAQARRTPDATALVFEGQSLSYAELDRRSNRLARHLASLGVGPEVPVALCLERSLELVVALLATLKAGGFYVPLDPGYPEERLRFMLDDCQARVLLTQSHLSSRLPSHGLPSVFLDSQADALPSLSSDAFPCPSGPDSLAYAIYTSGSTGRPKGAMNAHRAVVNRLLWMQDAFQLGPHDAVLQKTPFSFDVSVWEFFWPLLAGARLVLARPEGHKEPAYLARLIQSETVTTLHFVPSMLQAFLDAPEAPSCSALRRVICSGEALPFELSERFFSLLPHAQLHNLYGPTEAAVDVTAWRCQKGDPRRLVPIGRPIANTTTYVLDSRLQPQPIGIPGELYLGGVQVGRGYRNRQDLTAERFVPDPFSSSPGARLYRTGDLARLLPDGAIEYLGRLDHQVKLRGFRIELGEIESVLCLHPAVKQAVALVREDAPGDKRLVAYVVPAPGQPQASPSDLRAFLQPRLPEYMVPSAFVSLEALPLSPNGKLDRKALPDPRQAGGMVKEYVAPRDPLEEQLARMWSALLGLERVSIHDSFFELGGHSLLSMRLVFQLREAFGVDFSVRSLFATPTIARLAESLRGSSAVPRP